MPEIGGRQDPYQQFNFLVSWVGLPETQAGFMECSGLTTDTDAIDYREGDDYKKSNGMSVRKLSGLRKYTNVVLKRGYTDSKALWEWRKANITGKVQRKEVTITLVDEERNGVLHWQIHNAWISKWDSGPFNAKTNDVLVETVELIHEGLELVE